MPTRRPPPPADALELVATIGVDDQLLADPSDGSLWRRWHPRPGRPAGGAPTVEPVSVAAALAHFGRGVAPLLDDAAARRASRPSDDDAVEHVAEAMRAGVVLPGFHAVKHAMRFGAHLEVLVTDAPAALDALAAELAPDLRDRLAGATVVPSTTLARLAPRLSTPCLGVAHPWRHPAPERWAPGAPIVALDRPRHAGNVGAVVRVAAATGAAGVVLLDGPPPASRDVVAASAGLGWAVPTVGVPTTTDLLALVAATRRPLVGLDAGQARAVDVGDAPPPPAGPAPVYAFGSERRGLSDEVLAACDLVVSLPMRAGVSSLNLATAVAATLYVAGAPWTTTAGRGHPGG